MKPQSTSRKSTWTTSLSPQVGRPATAPLEKTRVPKLRPALDVLHRLRWDPSYADEAFIVGYEDRFQGVLEVAMSQWRAEQTDEEFIPQHRILYFKREADGVRVWDKKEKLDLVFGSGIVQNDGLKDEEVEREQENATEEDIQEDDLQANEEGGQDSGDGENEENKDDGEPKM